MRAAGACLLVLLCLPLGSAGASPAGPPGPTETKVRLPELKTRYPALTDLRFGSLAPRLADWVLVGHTIPVWVTDSRRRCAHALLARRPDVDDGPSFAVRTCKPDGRDEQGRPLRSCADEPVGSGWWGSDGGVTEVRIGRTWQPLSAWGIGDVVQGNGVLSEVTRDAARFRGRSAQITVTCTKAVFRCKNGGSQMCTRCDPPSVSVGEWSALLSLGKVGTIGKGVGTPDCDEPCPPVQHSSDEERLRSINSLEPWILADRREPFAGIYRSLAACQADAARFSALPSTHGER